MNERIKELAYQAGLYYYHRGTCCMDEMFPRYFNVAEADEAYTKFAELIILECAEMFEGIYTDEHPGRRIDTRIKQHFGV